MNKKNLLQFGIIGAGVAIGATITTIIVKSVKNKKNKKSKNKKRVK